MRVICSRLRLLIASITLVAGSAFAQAPSAPTGPLGSAQGETGAKPTAGQNLSEKLKQSNGLIHPKEVDPAIEKPAPDAHDPNVVPPPGTSGGLPAPQPK
jgi:hypothetical protein